VGQGLAGTWLSYYLSQQGISFVIINSASQASASKVASGVINPVTGRRMVQTWIIEEVLPFSVSAYTSMQDLLNTKIIQEAPVFLIHPSKQMKESFEYRLQHDNVYLQEMDENISTSNFNTPFGTGFIDSCYWIDLNEMLLKWKFFQTQAENYIVDDFQLKDAIITHENVTWKNIVADKIIFCDGINAFNNPYFNALPFAPNKGEALIVQVKNLPPQFIYKSTITLVPWKDDLFWVGSNYEWDFDHVNPSESFKQKMIKALDQLLTIPYEIKDHLVGVRPANKERRPFVGYHPIQKNVGILNGLGTKGCSLAPYFAAQFIANDIFNKPIHPEACLSRFKELLSKN
jgi:hypothetical protein